MSTPEHRRAARYVELVDLAFHETDSVEDAVAAALLAQGIEEQQVALSIFDAAIQELAPVREVSLSLVEPEPAEGARLRRGLFEPGPRDNPRLHFWLKGKA